MPTFEYKNDLSCQELRRFGFGDLGKEWYQDGANIASLNGQPVAAYKFDASGNLDTLEIKREFRRQGYGLKILKNIFRKDSFFVSMPNEDMLKLLGKYGDVKYNPNEGIAYVTPKISLLPKKK